MIGNLIHEITIEITNTCNMRCKICNIWQEKPRMIKISAIDRFIKSVASKYTIGSISLTGGEPFLHPQINEILQLMSSLRKEGVIDFFDINTNGYATQKILKVLKENRDVLDDCRIGISLDGIKEANAFIRGRPDAFKKTLGTIRALRSLLGSQAKLKVKFTISKFNYSQIYLLYRFCLRNKLIFSPKISEQNVRNYYHRNNNSPVQFSPLQQKSMRDSIKGQFERIFFEEKNRKVKTTDTSSLSLLIYLFSHDTIPIKSCMTPAKCLFVTSDQQIYCCLNMKAIGTMKDGISVIFGEKHKRLAAYGLRGNCPGCFAYHGFLSSINRAFMTS